MRETDGEGGVKESESFYTLLSGACSRNADTVEVTVLPYVEGYWRTITAGCGLSLQYKHQSQKSHKHSVVIHDSTQSKEQSPL